MALRRFYGFVDYGRFDGQETVYGELTPRLSLSKLTEKSFAVGPISDVFISLQVELGKKGLRRYQKGIGTNLDVPRFNFVKANYYHRKNPDRISSTWQVYLVPSQISHLLGKTTKRYLTYAAKA